MAPDPTIRPAATTASVAAPNGPPKRLITSDPVAFAAALDTVDNENEIQVVLKDPDEPRIAREVLEGLGTRSGLPVGLPETAEEAPRRGGVGFGNPDAATREGLVASLSALGADVYRVLANTPIISLRMDDSSRSEILRMLLAHPSVDFVEGNGRHAVESLVPTSARERSRPSLTGLRPETRLARGTSPTDPKHWFHRVRDTDPATEDAWDITKGNGAVIGVLDRGMTGEFPGIGWHPYGLELSSTSGIVKMGFADDYIPCSNETQAAGECEARDDKGHGSWMAGFAGANENNQWVVGIAPEALVVSMKVGTDSTYTRALDESDGPIQLMLEVTDDPGQYDFDVETIEVATSGGDGDEPDGGTCDGGGGIG